MKITKRVSKEEVREQASPLLSTISALSEVEPTQKGQKEYMIALALEEVERVMNHAFSEGRLFERRNPISK